MAIVTKEMIIADVLKIDEGTGAIFLGKGMRCIHCPSAAGESIEDACAVHGMDVDELVGELNAYIGSQAAKG
ncbi:MAG: DUF1858 domain-containing protein [Oscillospiraceae bacterium]|nr:DUF1858 domain-containing protein [Oscillospiraceae bacterium]